jgi:nicotinate-nucleotide--dimethylbenzimidazole phosphoribosyltransferase
VADLDTDLLILTDLGTQSGTAASALAATVSGGPTAGWVVAEDGEDEALFARRIEAVDLARARVGEVGPLELVRQLGGGDMVVMLGACLGARRRSIPVLIDGFAAAAAIAPLALADPRAIEHCIAAHVSTAPGHSRLLERIGVRSLFDLGVRAAEGVGTLALVPLLRMAVAAVVDVATVEEWGLR